MRTFISFLLLIILFSCEKEVSEKQADYFLKFYGTFRNDVASDLCELPDGGYALVGTSETDSRGTDITMVLTDKFGRQIGETKYFGTKDNDKCNGLYLFEGGLIISGAVANTIDTTILDAAIIQTDFAGNMIGNVNIFGGTNKDEAFSSIQKDDGGFLLVGYTKSNQLYIVSVDENFENPKPSENEDGIQISLKSIIKFRENQYFSAGTRTLSGSNGSQISILFINEAGNYVVAGNFGDPSKNNEFASLVQQNDSTLFVLSTLIDGSSSGKLNLKKIVYKLDPVNPEKILYMKERASYILSDAGVTANSLSLKDDGSLVLLATKTASSDENMVLLLIDENGNQIGDTKEFGGPGNQSGSSVICSDGSIVILGNNKGEAGVNTMITLIKTDNQGNLWD